MIDDFEARMEARSEIRRAERLLPERHIEILVAKSHDITDVELAREEGCSTPCIWMRRQVAYQRIKGHRKQPVSPPRYRAWPGRYYRPVLFNWFPTTMIQPNDHAKPPVDWAALVKKQEQDVRAYLQGLKL